MNAVEPLEVTEGIASLDERARLNLLPGATVYRIRRIRRQGNQILLVEDVRLPGNRHSGHRPAARGQLIAPLRR